jgi:cell wall-associated NlpC family hydrolase
VNSVSESAQRAAVVAEAKTWLGTPFRDQSDVKGAGVDCAMLLVRCFVDTGLVLPLDPRPYAPQWHLHRSEERFLGIIERLGAEVARKPIPGDVVVFRFGRCFSHGALVIDPANLLHAWYLEGRVTISPMHDVTLCQQKNGVPRPRKVFDCWARPSSGSEAVGRGEGHLALIRNPGDPTIHQKAR